MYSTQAPLLPPNFGWPYLLTHPIYLNVKGDRNEVPVQPQFSQNELTYTSQRRKTRQLIHARAIVCLTLSTLTENGNVEHAER